MLYSHAGVHGPEHVREDRVPELRLVRGGYALPRRRFDVRRMHALVCEVDPEPVCRRPSEQPRPKPTVAAALTVAWACRACGCGRSRSSASCSSWSSRRPAGGCPRRCRGRARSRRGRPWACPRSRGRRCDSRCSRSHNPRRRPGSRRACPAVSRTVRKRRERTAKVRVHLRSRG